MSKITKSANGERCTIRIPAVCSGDTDTVVAAHLGGGGMGRKKADLHVAYACYECHSAVDGHIKTSYDKDLLELWHRQGVERTQDILLKKGLISIL